MGFNIADTGKKRVVIIGGGFGGLKLANRLKGSNFQIVLIDKNNYHQFPPLLYQVASSGLESSSISFPFRKIFQKRKNFFFRLAEVRAIVREKNLVQTSIGELKYDYLIIASGTVTNFFGNEVIEKQALPMKTIEEALILRNTLLSNFEKATICTNPKEKQALMNIVIVGGGATGVEISGVFSGDETFRPPERLSRPKTVGDEHFSGGRFPSPTRRHVGRSLRPRKKFSGRNGSKSHTAKEGHRLQRG